MAVDLGEALLEHACHLFNFCANYTQVCLVVTDETQDILKYRLCHVSCPIMLNQETTELICELLATTAVLTFNLGILESLLTKFTVLVLDVGKHCTLAMEVVVSASKCNNTALVVVAKNCRVCMRPKPCLEKVF